MLSTPNKSLRIAYLHQYFATPEEATSTRSYELSRYWQAAGHNVTILTGTTDYEVDRSRTSDGVALHYCGLPYSQHYGTLARMASWIAYCIAASYYIARRHNQIDVIYASSTPLTVLVPALVARFAMGIPFIFEVRDVWPEVPIAMGRLRSRSIRFLSRTIARWGYRYSRNIIALSPDMAQLVSDNYDVPRNKITLAPNGTNISSDHPHPNSNGAPSPLHGTRTVLYMGTLGKVNAPEYIVRLSRAARDLDPTIQFTIFGSGSETAKCCDLATQLGVLDNGLEIHPRLPKPIVLERVAAADLSLSTTANIPILWANSANKVFESLGSGTPVAINHGGWLADFLEAKAVGVVLDREDISRAAQQLVSYLNDGPAATEDISDHCRHIAATHFDWQIISGDTLATIETSVFGSVP